MKYALAYVINWLYSLLLYVTPVSLMLKTICFKNIKISVTTLCREYCRSTFCKEKEIGKAAAKNRNKEKQMLTGYYYYDLRSLESIKLASFCPFFFVLSFFLKKKKTSRQLSSLELAYQFILVKTMVPRENEVSFAGHGKLTTTWLKISWMFYVHILTITLIKSLW